MGLFYIGNFSVLYNFIAKNNSLFFKFALLLILLFNLNYKLNLKINLLNLVNFIILPGILSISTITIGFAYDAGLYHLNTQHWIRESNIPIGLSNLHFRYGFSSIIDYISSSFWLNGNFEIIHFVNLSFISSFVGIISYGLIQRVTPVLSMSSFAILIFGILDNFGKGGGRNGFIDIESVTKQDTPFGIIFYLTNILIIYCIKKNKASDFELLTISFLLLFGIQLRIFGLISVVLFMYLIIKTNSTRVKLFIPSIFFGSFWLIKNILISGCLIYPIEITCFDNLNWSNAESAMLELTALKDFHVGYNYGSSILDWYSLWSAKEINNNVTYNFIFSLIFIFVLLRIFGKYDTLKFNKNSRFFLSTYYLLVIGVWIITSPGIRLGIGIFLILIGLIGSNYKSLKVGEKKFTIFMYVLVFVSTLLIPKLDNYYTLIKDPLSFNKISPAEVSYIPKEGYGVLPKDGSQCWINIECIYNQDKINYSELGFYKLFTIQKNN
jgi:hypothetical protein